MFRFLLAMMPRALATMEGSRIREYSDRRLCFRNHTTSAASPSRVWLTCLVVFVGLASSASTLMAAAGHEVVNRDQDIVLQVDSRWPGNAYGGYFPLRIRLSNMGPPRDLMLVFKARDNRSDSALPEVRRFVRIEQQATINFTLSIPVVTKATEGGLRVFDVNGSELEGLASRHSLPDYGGHQPRTSLLVISSDNLDDKALQPFEDAATTESAYLSGMVGGSTPSYYSGAHYSGQAAERDHVVVQPTHNLPVNWIDYSGLDLVAVAWPDWNAKLSATEREAILKWTATGGVLILFGTGQPAAQSVELNRSLQLQNGAAAGWTDCVPAAHRATNIVTADQFRTGMYPAGGISAVATTTAASPEVTRAEEAAKLANKWKISTETFAHRNWTLGKIYAFPDNPFPGTAEDWTWWLSSLPTNLSQWPKKMGQSARGENVEFLNFLIPGVGSVPVFAFLTLITLFTVIIGPLNYYWLLKRRRLAVMVFTVPLIAAVTCLLLFAYSLVADGFSTRSRVHSFTWIDQQRKSAVSDGRICLYAPFAPSTGLTFSPECAVFSIWPTSSGFESGVLDWSGNDQRLTAGWFRSQTWTQFQTLEYRDERGRLDFTPPSDPSAATITVSNGLAWDLDYLAINTSNSTWYAGENVPAGATAELKLQAASAINTHFAEVFKKKAWEYPKGVSPGSTSSPIYGSRSYRHFGMEQPLQTDFNNGLFRRNLPGSTAIETLPKSDSVDWRDGRNTRYSQSHPATQQPHYWAVSRTSPGLQTGIKSSVDHDSLHVLFGTF